MHSSPPRVVLIVGQIGHGKSSVRAALSAASGLRGASCSDLIYEKLARKRGVTVASLRQIPKEQLRPELVALGDWLVGVGDAASPAGIPWYGGYRGYDALVWELFDGGFRIIDGVRRRVEMLATLARFRSMGVEPVVVHVERPMVPSVRDNSEDLRDFADFHVVNDGSREELAAKVRDLAEQLSGLVAA